MRSIVIAGSSKTLSRVPVPAAADVHARHRRLIEHDRGNAGGNARVLRMSNPDAGDVGDEIALGHRAEPITRRSHRCDSRRIGLHWQRRPSHLAAMTADVSIFAALFAGVISFLSPCVLPLVPPYLVYLAGTSLERLAEAEPPPRVRRETVLAAAVCSWRAFHRVRGARCRRQRGGIGVALLFQRARDGGRRFHHHHGAALSRHHADQPAQPAGAPRRAEAGWAMGRLCDGAGLRVRLDAVHRTDPGGDPRRRRIARRR